jgi:hypothetical protein
MKKAKKSSNSRKIVPVRTIAVSNDLLRMQVVMTPEEINAFFYVITKINPNTAPGQPMIVRFNIKDFVDTMRGIGYEYKNKKRLFESFRSLQRKTSGLMFNDGEKIWLVSVFNDICPDDNQRRHHRQNRRPPRAASPAAQKQLRRPRFRQCRAP